MKTTERRRHVRAIVDCEMAIQIGTDYIPSRVCNVAEGGVLGLLPENVSTSLRESDEGICWLDYENEGFEAKFRIARLSGNYIALFFLTLDEKQKSFLERLIAAG